MFQMASPQDRAELKDLWQLCFQESQPFLDWFFTDRFLPAYCPIYREDGVIQAALHGLPAHMRVRDRIAPCVIIAGVATHSGFPGPGADAGAVGLLPALFGGLGIPLATHRPVTLRTYASAGHFPVSDSRYLSLARTPPAGGGPLPAGSPPERASELYGCYQRFSLGYSCILSRSYADFFLKCKDYLASDAKCILTRDAQGQVEGYCVYFDSPGEGAEPPSLYGEECVRPVSGSLWKAVGKPCSAQPGQGPEGTHGPQRAPMPGGRPVGDPAPQAYGGWRMFPACWPPWGCRGKASWEVEDPLVASNRGLYTLCGQPAQGKPQLVIPAGRLAQWASGYRTMAQLVAEGQAQALDPAIVPHSGRRAPPPLLHHRRILIAYWGTASPSTWPMGWRKIRSARRS